MKREVIRWYNALREEWGLELIGEEPEETDDLVQDDFRFGWKEETWLEIAETRKGDRRGMEVEEGVHVY